MTIDWNAATSNATAVNGYLATITSPSENAFIFDYLTTVTAFVGVGDLRGPFLGGYQDRLASDYSEPRGGWRWVTGEPWAASNWDQYGNGEPNNDAGGSLSEDVLTMDRRWGGVCVWNDSPVSGLGPRNARLASGYLVEFDADCNNDGLVDYGQILSGQLADTNQNGVPDTCEVDPCPGDVTDNGTVDGVDLAALLAAWGGGKSQFDCDVDNDGIVGGSDLAAVLAGWGACP
jgi:hypothetical protein